MSISLQQSEDGKQAIITIDGKLDFNTHHDFRQAYQSIQPGTAISIDFKNTTALDSSGLGMMLLFREHFGGDQANIKLLNCNDEVRRVFDVSNFARLFDIS